MVNIIQKKSKIHGIDQFAARDFKKDELVIKWNTHKQLTKKEIDDLPEKEKQNISYINKQYISVPPEGQINHSCDPNVYLLNFCYMAKRDIKKGEELTTNYKAESEPDYKFKCNCGSKKCNGTNTL